MVTAMTTVKTLMHQTMSIKKKHQLTPDFVGRILEASRQVQLCEGHSWTVSPLQRGLARGLQTRTTRSAARLGLRRHLWAPGVARPGIPSLLQPTFSLFTLGSDLPQQVSQAMLGVRTALDVPASFHVL